MTNTKFRRRALISSVAMLLVALVALGSATFAWFTDNPVANATGITGKGETSTGLIIETDTDGGGTFTGSQKHTANLFKSISNDFILAPAWHTTTVGNFISAAAGDSSLSAADTTTGKKWASVTVNNSTAAAAADVTGVYTEKIYLRTTGQGTTATNVYLTNLTITTASATMSPAVCVDVVAGGSVIGTYKIGSTKVADYGSAAAGAQVASSSTYKTTYLQGAGGFTTALGTASDSTSLEVTLYVYLDGSDPSVTTDNASAAELFTNVNASFSTIAPSSNATPLT